MTCFLPCTVRSKIQFLRWENEETHAIVFTLMNALGLSIIKLSYVELSKMIEFSTSGNCVKFNQGDVLVVTRLESGVVSISVLSHDAFIEQYTI